jgi:hypothetical protein
MVNLFNKPYREFEKPGDRLIALLSFGLFIFLFLFLFKPFGMDRLEPVQQALISFGFGLVTTFMLVVYKYLIEPAVFYKNRTFGMSIIWDFVITVSIGIANFFYITLVLNQVFELRYLLGSIWTAILVGSIPVTIKYIITYNRMYRIALKEAAIHPEEMVWEQEVIIRAGNPKNEFKSNPRHIIYLCSNDNYVTIVTINKNNINKTTIRGTLKAAENELRKNSLFIRCHKCYLVNVDFVKGARGNNQNMVIRLLPDGTEIPVSRSRAGIFREKIRKN